MAPPLELDQARALATSMLLLPLIIIESLLWLAKERKNRVSKSLINFSASPQWHESIFVSSLIGATLKSTKIAAAAHDFASTREEPERRRKDKREWGEKRRKKIDIFSSSFVLWLGFSPLAGLLSELYKRFHFFRPYIVVVPFHRLRSRIIIITTSLSLSLALYGAIMVKCSLVVVSLRFRKIQALEPKKREMRKRREEKRWWWKLLLVRELS